MAGMRQQGKMDRDKHDAEHGVWYCTAGVQEWHLANAYMLG